MNETPIIFRCKCQTGRVLYVGTETLPGGRLEFFERARSFSTYSRCWTCGFQFKFREVHGKFSAKHICSAKCQSSVGPACECSCRGKNHGGAYGGA